MAGPSPTPDYMDSLALFTHGEFLCFDNEDPELLLYTHGEFPRPARVRRGPGDRTTTSIAVGQGRRSYDVLDECDLTLEEIAAVMLILDEA